LYCFSIHNQRKRAIQGVLDGLAPEFVSPKQGKYSALTAKKYRPRRKEIFACSEKIVIQGRRATGMVPEPSASQARSALFNPLVHEIKPGRDELLPWLVPATLLDDFRPFAKFAIAVDLVNHCCATAILGFAAAYKRLGPRCEEGQQTRRDER